MSKLEHFDDLVIGSGQGGVPLATELAAAGRKVALVERGPLGGTCINTGCTPTKTLVAGARVAYLARRAADFGVRARKVGVDMAVVRERKRAIVRSFRAGTRSELEGTEHLTVVHGAARFTDPRTVAVLAKGRKRVLEAERIFVNTGVRPAVPEIAGLADVPHLNSASIQELDRLPEHLLVLGGGYIGVEFGQMFRRFGSRVTLIEHGPQILAREDAEFGAAVAAVLREDGLELVFGAEIARARLGKSGKIALALETADGARKVSGTHLLVATGQVPNTDGLGLDQGGVATDARGYVVVNARLETNVPGVWALGDVKGGPAFTHISFDDYRVLRANLLGKGGASIAGRLVPYVVYMDPELARVGLSEREAKERGLAVRVACMPMDNVARALEMDESRGLMKALVDRATERIVGFACLGVQAGELMSVVEVAMLGNLPYTALREAIFAHPTLAESLNNLFENLED